MYILKKIEEKKEIRKKLYIKQKNIESTNRLIEAFHSAKSNVEGIASDEGRHWFSRTIDTFVEFLNTVAVIELYDVTKIDTILAEIIDFYSEALKTGDLETSKLCTKYIYDALMEFRKEQGMDKSALEDELLEKHVDALSKRKNVLVLSRELFINQKKIEKAERECLDHTKQFDDLYMEIKQLQEERPDLFDLENFRPGIDEINPEAYALHLMLKKANAIWDYVDFLREIISDSNKKINELKHSLKEARDSF